MGHGQRATSWGAPGVEMGKIGITVPVLLAGGATALIGVSNGLALGFLVSTLNYFGGIPIVL